MSQRGLWHRQVGKSSVDCRIWRRRQQHDLKGWCQFFEGREGAGMAGWNADTAAGPLGAGAVTLVEGSSFCISLANGDIHPEHPHGLFVLDTRILSGWSLTVNGQPLEPLAAETKEPYRAVFASRVARTDGYADSPLLVERLREVGAGIQEQVTVRNYGLGPAECVGLPDG